jgi:hypothetical protein
MVAGLAFRFYSEARIAFMPTYKFDIGTDEYDSSYVTGPICRVRRHVVECADNVIVKKHEFLHGQTESCEKGQIFANSRTTRLRYAFQTIGRYTQRLSAP